MILGLLLILRTNWYLIHVKMPYGRPSKIPVSILRPQLQNGYMYAYMYFSGMDCTCSTVASYVASRYTSPPQTADRHGRDGGTHLLDYIIKSAKEWAY